ncbi:MAG: hypothetical protein QXH55_04605, partial [Candidatus Korarchaeota archaeon]
GAEIVIETPEGTQRVGEESEIRVEKREQAGEIRIEEKMPEPPPGGVRITFRGGKPTVVEPEGKSSEIIVEKREAIEEEKPKEESKEQTVRITFKKGKPIIEE